jgi:hypothetical protein
MLPETDKLSIVAVAAMEEYGPSSSLYCNNNDTMLEEGEETYKDHSTRSMPSSYQHHHKYNNNSHNDATAQD